MQSNQRRKGTTQGKTKMMIRKARKRKMRKFKQKLGRNWPLAETRESG